MQNALAIRLAIENLRSVAFGSISVAYAPLGIPLSNPSRKIFFFNNTDVLITFSDDGVNDKFVLPSGGQFILDETLDKSGDYTAQGTQFYVKGTPTMGSVYLSTWYGAN